VQKAGGEVLTLSSVYLAVRAFTTGNSPACTSTNDGQRGGNDSERHSRHDSWQRKRSAVVSRA
jgi:hypothetical protein